MSIKVN